MARQAVATCRSAILGLHVVSGDLAIVIARRKPATALMDLESLKLKAYSLSVYGQAH